MARLLWDQVGEKTYETGTKQGVLYLQASNGTYTNGVAWNGLTSVSESPDGGDANDIYADDIKYLVLRGVENFGGTIEAYTYPPEFEECDGSATLLAGVNIGQQPRKTFGFSYVSTIGNDTELDSHGYKIHLIYGASASPSERSYETINDSPEPIHFSWEFTTVPVAVTGHKATSLLTIDSTKFTTEAQKAKLKTFEDILYGTNGTTTYVDFYGDEFEDSVTYYERTGSEGSYEYIVTTDDTKSASKTYYTLEEVGGTNPRLPLPDEVVKLLRVA